MNRPLARNQACMPRPARVPPGNDNGVSADTVLEQSETEYDAAGKVIDTRQRHRLDTASGAGASQGPHGVQPQVHVITVCPRPDAIGRQRTVADCETNGGFPVQRPGIAPERSETVHVSIKLCKDSGDANRAIDPMGIEARWDWINIADLLSVWNNGNYHFR